jgi:hypothetical protein
VSYGFTFDKKGVHVGTTFIHDDNELTEELLAAAKNPYPTGDFVEQVVRENNDSDSKEFLKMKKEV